MNREREHFVSRVAIDSQLPKLQEAARALSQPRDGWIRLIRSALGMSSSDLARRLNVAPSTVLRYQENEIAGTVNLDTMKKIADELNCELIVALVPRKPLREMVFEQAAAITSKNLMSIAQTMSLENQAVDPEALLAIREREIGRLVESGKLWREIAH